MLALGDVAELWRFGDSWKALQRVPHDYSTKHSRKYVGTALEAGNSDYPRKNQSSLMLWNCGHYANRILTPEFVQERSGADLHRFSWLGEERWLGELPFEWNWLVGEQEFNPKAKLAHFTLGQPGFKHYSHGDYADLWKSELQKSLEGMQYEITARR
jgi:hypothetical protein